MIDKPPVKHRVAQGIARYFGRHPWVLVGVAIVYFLSPVDLIPEMLVGPVGYLDDFFVLLLPFLLREYAKKLTGESEKTSRPKDYYDTTAH